MCVCSWPPNPLAPPQPHIHDIDSISGRDDRQMACFFPLLVNRLIAGLMRHDGAFSSQGFREDGRVKASNLSGSEETGEAKASIYFFRIHISLIDTILLVSGAYDPSSRRSCIFFRLA